MVSPAIRATKVTLELQDIPLSIQSVSVIAQSYANSNELNTYVNVTPKSTACSTAAGKTTCAVVAAAFTGADNVTVTGTGLPNGGGKTLFQTKFVATVKPKGATAVTVPNAIYVKDYAVPGAPTGSITKGPGTDSHLWFLDESANQAYVDSSSTTGSVKPYLQPTFGGSPNGYTSIEAGNGSTLWFVSYAGDQSNAFVDSITTGGTIKQYPTTYAPNCSAYNVPTSIANGPDGNAWFLEFTCGGGGAVGVMSPNGTVHDYALPVDTQGFQLYTLTPAQHQIVAGADGALWFYADRCGLVNGACTQGVNGAPTIGRITTGGGMQFFPLTYTSACSGGSVALGGDGNVWFLRPTTKIRSDESLAAARSPTSTPGWVGLTI
jgi:hypothetical protein